MGKITKVELAEIANGCGLTVMSVTSAEPLEQDAGRLKFWQDQGYAGDMKYMLRPPEQLSSPRQLLPNARSVITFALQYSSVPHPALLPGFGRVARYAWGEDYHTVLKSALEQFAQCLADRAGVVAQVRSFTDAVPLLERALAARGQMGFIGKNTMLIRPRQGSHFFLGEVITDVDIQDDVSSLQGVGCGACSRCGSACPTGALDQPYQLDARRCTSYLTIEKRGVLSDAECRMIGEWIFGCDICQDVCPFNHRALKGAGLPAHPQFEASRGVGPLIELADMLLIRTNRQFRSRFGKTALMRARRAGLLRNAAIVAANTRALMVLPAILAAVVEDSSATVRLHCAASLRMLHPELTGLDRQRVRDVLEKVASDRHQDVALEARKGLEVMI